MSQYFPPDTGGASTRSSNVVRSLVRKGHEVTVVTAVPHYPHGDIPHRYRSKLISLERFEGARVVRVRVPSIAHDGTVRRLIMYVSFAVSALMAVPFCRGSKLTWAMSPNYLCMLPAVACKISTRSKIVHDVVDIWPQALMATGYSLPRGVLRAVSFLSLLSYIFSDTIVTLSDTMTTSLRKIVSKSIRIEVIENCVDNEFFTMGEERRGGPFHIMYLGTLGPSNDFEALLEAASKLRHDSRIRFTIAGAGERAPKIRQIIKEKNITNVDLQEGAIRHGDVPEWLFDADAMVLPLRSGFGNTSFPSKLGEYLATGRPVVSMVDGHLARVISENELGILLAPGDTMGLVHALEELRQDATLCKKLGTSGRNYATLHLSNNSFALKVDKVLELNAPATLIG